MRKRLFEIIEQSETKDSLGRIYNAFMIAVVFISLIPLAFKQHNAFLHAIEIFSFLIFLCDYVLRWITADFRLKQGRYSFAKYPFSFMAVVDLLSILPIIPAVNDGFKLLRVIRVIKIFRYFRSGDILLDVIKKSKEPLMAVSGLSVGYILVSALIMFNAEADSFEHFLDAIYWATISLTTVGYGDIHPVTTVGKLIAMFSAFFGIAIIALPAGIITAGYMNAFNDKK